MKKEKKQKAVDTKSRILEVSEKLFADKGFDNTGIDEIARKVGIAKSVIYYHFKNKDDILNTILKNFFNEAMEFKKQTVDKFFADPQRDYKETLRTIIKFMDTRRNRLARIILMESIKNTEKIPLFELWEKNALITSKLYEGKIKNVTNKDIMLELFFMCYLPWVGYHVFADRLSEHYGFKKEEVMEIFIDAIHEYVEKIVRPKVWNF